MDGSLKQLRNLGASLILSLLHHNVERFDQGRMTYGSNCGSIGIQSVTLALHYILVIHGVVYLGHLCIIIYLAFLDDVGKKI